MPLRSLLERGYFPKEIPSPPFTTAPFAKAVPVSTVTLPDDFRQGHPPTHKIPTAKVGRYSHARGGLLRRELGICNPLHYYLLSKVIVDHWSIISPHVLFSRLAATAPAFKTTGRAIDGLHSQSHRTLLAQKNRIGGKYLLQTDISRFYNSIYTHSIPWAIHTKSVAKKRRGRALVGNNIDYIVRMGQDGQTIGIPIGPDTSLVIAELILQRCDKELISITPNIKGHRFIDDYELSFPTRSEAETAFHQLEMLLRDFELALNPKKTRVIELPDPLEPAWVTELRNQPIRSSINGQARDIETLMNKAFGLHKKHPDEPVLSYAIARLRTIPLHPDNWLHFQRCLLLCVIPEPATFPYAIELIIKWVNAGFPAPIPELEEVVNTIILTHAPLSHSSEISHALWACLALRLNINEPSAKALSQANDSVSALMALDCESKGLITTGLSKAQWERHMTAESLYDEHWLLAYEANIKGWLPTVGGGDHVAADPNFGFLKASDVYFYDITSIATAPIPSPTLPTLNTLRLSP